MNVDSRIYLDEARFVRERDFIAQKSWLIAAHTSELAKPGGFRVFSRLGHSVVVMRNRNGKVVAFRNQCLHRGSYLLEGRGRCATLTCPYHGWRYDLDGKLLPNLAERLEPVPVYERGGFIWIFSGKATKSSDPVGASGRYFDAFNTGDFTVFRRRQFNLDCNWKNYLENILDSYHIAQVHNPLLGKIAKVQGLKIEREGLNLALKIPIADYRWRILFEKHAAGRSEDLARFYYKIYLFPNTVINFTALSATLYSIWPIAAGKTLVEYTYLRARSLNPLVYIRNLLLFRYSMLINREDNAILPKYYANIAKYPGQKHRFIAEEESLVQLHQSLRKVGS